MKRRLLLAACALAVALGCAAVLMSSGAIQLNRPSREKYPVRGVDVSA